MAEAIEKKKSPRGLEHYSAAEIVKLVDDKRNSQAFQDLYNQMESDFGYYSLEPYKAEEGHQSYTSPKPLNDFDKVFSSVNKADLTWSIKIPESASEEERKKASIGEALITGILDQTDRKRRKIGEPTLRASIAWFACARGSEGQKVLLYSDEDKDGEITVDLSPLDSLWMVWEKGNETFVWIANIYHVGKTEAMERWGKDIGDDKEDGIVIDFFTRTHNAVILYAGTIGENGPEFGEFVKPFKLHGLDHVPVYVGFAGGMPNIRQKDNKLALKQRATSVFAASRQVYTPMNKQISFLMDVAEKSVAGALTYLTEDGKKMLQGDPFGAWKVIPLKKGEEIKALDPPKAPPESGAILGALDKDLQQSTIPFPIGYGLDPQAHSGTALSMINDNTRSVYSPFTGLLEDVYLWICEEILSQFKQKGQKMKLQGYDKKGKYFELEASPDDIDDSWYVEVKCEPKLPRDEAAELQMAIAARQPRQSDGEPLLDDLTILEDILKVQDPDATLERRKNQKIEAQIEALPGLKIRRMAEALLKKGDKQGAEEILAMAPAPSNAGNAGTQPPPGQSATSMPPGSNGVIPGGGQQPTPEQIIQMVAQELGLPPEQVAQMPPEQIQAMMAAKQRQRS